MGTQEIVDEGQTLVTLDAATLASLEESVAQVQIDLRDAEDAFAEVNSSPSPLDLA